MVTSKQPEPLPADPTSPRPTVAVVFGGRSSEHEISCVSAGNVLAAIDREKYDVLAVGIGRDGGWRLVDDDPESYRIAGGVLPRVSDVGQEVVLAPDPTAGGLRTVDGRRIRVDVVFPVLHGAGGEDGSIQGVCELAGIACVGSGVAASAVCMDKLRTKSAALAAGIPVGPYVEVTDWGWQHERDRLRDQIDALGYPVFVKPARAGSSVGISKVATPEEVEQAITEARTHDRRVIVEAAVAGAREIECSVLVTDSGPQVSPCAEIEVLGDHEFYDFDAKYLDGSARITVPAVLTQAQLAAVQNLVLETFMVLGCEGMARIDTFLVGDQVLLNEPNTIPGFTSTSMYPVLWQHAGIDYPLLIDTLIDDARRRALSPEVSGR